MRKLHFSFLLLAALAVASPAFARQDTAIAARLLSVNSDSYPAIDAYISVVDQDRLVPITDLSAQDFFIDTDTGQALTLLTVTNERRPLHVVVVMDLTGSVSDTELANQATAVRGLADDLSPGDQLGLVIMDNAQTSIVAPLQSDTVTALAALDTLTPNADVTGNVYWDGIYTAVNMLDATSKDARQAVIVMTDLTAGGGAGSKTEQETIALAIQRGVEVYGLHFEFEGDLPDNPPVIPPDLTIIAQATGGSTLGIAAQLISPENYTDDEALPIMMDGFADLVLNEYKLAITSPLPANGSTQGLNISLTYQGSTLPPLRGSFTAGAGSIVLEFVGLSAEQNITLPYTVNVNASSSAGTIQKLTAFAVNEAGQRALLGELDPAAPSLSIEPGMVAAGTFRLVVEAQDSAGNTSEADIFLKAVESLSVTLVDVPGEIEVNQLLTLVARIGMAETVQNASFTINGEQRELRTLPPFNDMAFQWQPDQTGEYELQVRVEDQSGATASQSVKVTVKAAAGGTEEGGLSLVSVLVAAFVLGVFVIVGGSSAVWWRVRRRKVSVASVERATSGLIDPTTPSEIPTGDHAAAEPLPPPVTSVEVPPPPVTALEQPPRTMTAVELAPPPIIGVEVPPPPIVSAHARYADAELHGSGGERWRLRLGENTIGRHSSNTIQLKDESASRYHAKIEALGETFTFYDWQASHPSELNGALLEAGKRYELNEGDMIRVGSSLMKFVKLEKEQ